MTYEQLLLLKLAEECQEVAQRAMKSIQFGAGEMQKNQEKTNAQRLRDEVNDLEGVLAMLENTAELAAQSPREKFRALVLKQEKVQKYYLYSQKLGMVE